MSERDLADKRPRAHLPDGLHFVVLRQREHAAGVRLEYRRQGNTSAWIAP